MKQVSKKIIAVLISIILIIGSCPVVFADNTNDNYTYIDDDTGVVVTTQSTATFKADFYNDLETEMKLEENVYQGITVRTMYDLAFFDGDTEVSVQDKMTVRIPVASSSDYIYYVDDNGLITRITYSYDSGYAVFETENTGIYAVMGAILYTYTDKDTGVTVVTYKKDSLKVEIVDDSEYMNIIDGFLGADYTKTIYRLILCRNGVELPPATSFTIYDNMTIKLPANNSDDKAYFVQDYGYSNKNAVYEDGYLTFTDNKFSDFAVVSKILHTYTDEETGVSVSTYIDGSMDVQIIEDTELNDELVDELGADVTTTVYDINLLRGGKEVNTKKGITAKIPVVDENSKIYYWQEQGTHSLKEIPYTFEDGYAVFQNKYAGKFVVASDELYTYTDDDTGIVVTTHINGEMEAPICTDVNLVYSFDKKLYPKTTKVIYDVKLTKNGKEVEPNKNATVKIPVESSCDEIYYQSDSSTSLALVEYTYQDGYAVFETTNTGKYTVVAKTLYTYTDEATGVSICTYLKGKIGVYRDDRAEYNYVLDKLLGIESLVDVYDIKFYDFLGEQLEKPQGGITIKIPVTNNNQKVYRVYYNGHLSALDAIVSDGYAIFDTDSTGEFLIAEKTLYTYTDENTGVSIDTYLKGSIAVSATGDEALYASMDEALGTKEATSIFEIDLFDISGKEVTGDEYGITFRIPVTAEDDCIYRINSDGTFVLVETDFIDGFAVFSSNETGAFAVASEETFLLGDANFDGVVNIKDATLIQKHIASLETISGYGALCADSDMDSKITIKDATAIQKYLAGIEIPTPVGEYVKLSHLK